ncbi:MAG: indole-3-glycerol phosphate synthase TrpC [Clostridiales Family XIII bacterium]|jgi:indole-3-glycerol phosphate synthase|nr:indole-3-glycerol phosphate synthase TrpC [Clostridiales Family XIII bacterium]
MSNILDDIVGVTIRRVEDEKVEGRILSTFEQALSRKGIAVIAEVKKASPSKGVIVSDFDHLQIAEEYVAAGANAISVLTEPRYFMGSAAYLKDIASAVSIPVLRKDFIIDPYQIYEAKFLGASAVLLIASVLEEDDALKFFLDLTYSLGMSALVETHDEAEIKRAVKVGAKIIGVNNRNLNDFSVDLENSIRLRDHVPENIIFVSESGIKTAEDVRKLEAAGVDAILVGESIVKSPDKTAYLDTLLGR